jgi:NAD(P)-dependent dehydrogenase (short-subunit alcohol dehydrogenase family)
MVEAANDLEGKVLLVTGGTDGIGKAAAHALAKRRATLVLVGRDPEKTARVAGELRAASGQRADSARVETITADLTRLADVRAAAERFRATHDRLDVLVNNAGAMFDRTLRSADGHELTFALNHLAYFQLTVALLDVLEKTPGARVVSTASGAHRRGRIDLEDIAAGNKDRLGFLRYSDSKLANILFTRELARRLAGTGVVATCFHPGFIASSFGHNTHGVTRAITTLLQKLRALTPEQGADTLVWLATSTDAAARESGGYFVDRKRTIPRPQAQDDAMAARLWELSERLCAAR